ncbi:signal peptidase II [Thaumasiovibrio subtropicus]|uniref:signal peptidase II n=1 Tax=Thaumasiovibrio subtropicus TaxID=1891207 RepID=UPI000B3582B9|nr:signal peptidase II [Thaumasiovibrio subtropicus]
MSFRIRLKIFSIISVVFIGIDQLTKHLAATYLTRDHAFSYFSDLFRLGYAENTGAFLGLGNGLPPTQRYGLFVVAIGMMLLAMAVYSLANRKIPQNTLIGLSLLFAGGISNFYDRVVNNGAVIDFLNLGLGSVRTGVFNVADMVILVGAAVLVFTRQESIPSTQTSTH